MITIQEHQDVYGNNTEITVITNSKFFKFKIKITGNIPADGNIKNVEKAVPLKYLKWKFRNV